MICSILTGAAIAVGIVVLGCAAMAGYVVTLVALFAPSETYQGAEVDTPLDPSREPMAAVEADRIWQPGSHR